MKKIIYFITLVLAFTSCDLDETPKARANQDPIFGSERGLSIYTNSFYTVYLATGFIPNWGDIVNTFYAAYNGINKFYSMEYTSSMEGSWDWGALRNINYFLDHNVNKNLNENVRNNYNGIARYFRARFYFDKMKTYGDVPWIDHALDVKDQLLTASRTPRTPIADRIYEDLQFAIEHITDSDPTRTTITKYVAAGLQSRFCLWEGTFRKYHTEAGLQDSADKWLQRARQAAEIVINSGQFSIYMKGDTPYRDMFVAKEPKTEEVMLATVFDAAEGITHSETRRSNTTTLGGPFSPIRQIVNLYLKKDGTAFTDNPAYKTTPFTQEFDNRDERAAQTLRTPGLLRLSGGKWVRTAPDYACAKTGYHALKFALDDVVYDGGGDCENNKIEMRYAEILLNWAEAKAELGTLTDADWTKSIGALRARGGITGGLTTKPTKVDTYMQSVLFPEISDPTVMEVRRERLIELMFEDFTLGDQQRWKKGDLMALPREGIYVPQFNTLLDMDNDGTPDVYFYTSDSAPENKVAGVYYRHVQMQQSGSYSDDTAVAADGHTLLFNVNTDPIQWNDRMYFHPVSQTDRILNPNLSQNAGY